MAIETLGIAAYMALQAGLARGGALFSGATSSRPIYRVSQELIGLDAINKAPSTKGLYGSQPSPSDLDRLIGRVNSYLSVAPGWDGEDAVAPPSGAVADAIAFLVLFASLSGKHARLPSTMLSPDGTVGLYWHSDESYLDVEFMGDGKLSRFERKGAERSLEEGLAITRDAILPIVDSTAAWKIGA